MCRAVVALCCLLNQHQEMKKDSEIYGLRSKFHQTSCVTEELGIKGNLSENLKYKTQQGAVVIDDEISEIWLLCINV